MADLGCKKVRKSNFSLEEVEALVNTVSKHYNILYGEFAKRAVNKHARHRVWLDVTKQVNRVSIERRTLQEVKNKWKKCQHLYRDPDKLEFPEDFVVPNVWEPLTANKDSMPLEQRLAKNPAEQEAILQSQPLSPTKLKVTRQAAKPTQPSPKPPTPEPPNEEVCLRWNSHHSNMQSTFPNLLLREQYVDATLVAEGQTLKCHRLILSSCSPYFEDVLSGISPFQHPVLFMRDIPYWILKSLCDFMYAGEVHIFQNKLEELLAVAETLKIKGLAGKTEGTSEESKPSESIKEEKRDEKEVREKRRHPQPPDTPAPKPNSKPFKSSHTSRRVTEKIPKEIVKNDDILDPLDLLEPVYEELTKESKSAIVPIKFRETKGIPMKKGLPKKLKKRKLSEEREESPPPLFLSRKGTRSRPNVKIPKYYHTHYERAAKNLEFPESTIVREPHTDQADPLMEVEEIKTEPLDFQDDVIEIEDNMVSFSDQEMPSLQEEEIIGNYDSPIVNINDSNVDSSKDEDAGTVFKKISLLPQPIIMDVHSISDKPPSTLKIVDVAQIKTPTDGNGKTDEPLDRELALEEAEISREANDPLNFTEPAEKTSHNITITNVESIAEVGVNAFEEKSDNQKLELCITKMASEHKEDKGDPTFHIAKMVSEGEENDASPEFHIARVVSENEETRKDHGDPRICIENTGSGQEEVGECSARPPKSQIANEVNDNENIKGDNGDPSVHIEKVVSEHMEIKEGNGEANSNFHIGKVVSEEECEDNEKSTALGFHIAKVASEQFTTNVSPHENDGKGVISEDHANELGFQITNVVSAHFEDSGGEVSENTLKDSNNSALDTIVNDLSGIKVEESCEKDIMKEASAGGVTHMNNKLIEDTTSIVDSLEELLEK